MSAVVKALAAFELQEDAFGYTREHRDMHPQDDLSVELVSLYGPQEVPRTVRGWRATASVRAVGTRLRRSTPVVLDVDLWDYQLDEGNNLAYHRDDSYEVSVVVLAASKDEARSRLATEMMAWSWSEERRGLVKAVT